MGLCLPLRENPSSKFIAVEVLPENGYFWAFGLPFRTTPKWTFPKAGHFDDLRQLNGWGGLGFGRGALLDLSGVTGR